MLRVTTLKYLIFLIIVSLFSGCKDQKIKVGFLMDDFSAQRWYRDRDLFVSKVTELGGEVLVDSALTDAKKQIEQAKKMISSGVDVLVVVPANSDAAAEIVLLAHQNKIPVLSYDRLIRNCQLDYYISFENSEVGEQMADYLYKRCPVGKYVMINGPATDNNSFFIKFGQLAVLQPIIEKGDIQIVYEGTVNEWNTEEGYNMMKECLKKNKDINAVLAANDALARGIIRALEEEGLAGKVLVSGMDAEVDAIRAIIAGTQTMTVYKPIEAIAFTAASAAVKIAKNEPLTEANQFINNGKKMVPSILLPSMVVNRDNINMTVMADGYLKEHKLQQ